jgi:hypothetical protein
MNHLLLLQLPLRPGVISGFFRIELKSLNNSSLSRDYSDSIVSLTHASHVCQMSALEDWRLFVLGLGMNLSRILKNPLIARRLL